MFGLSLNAFFESIIGLVSSMGYLGIFLLMVIESSILPMPSELILIPAGILIARGEMSFVPVFVLSVLGSMTGAYINYQIAYHLGRKNTDRMINKYGKFLFINKKNMEDSEKFFNKHGKFSTFLGRLVPVVRHIISLPAGFYKMRMLPFLTFTALGAAVWSFILIYLGYWFGSNQTAAMETLGSLKYLILLIVVLSIIVYVLWQKITNHKSINAS